MAMAGAATGSRQADPAFAENVRGYYEHVRENDLLLTHTLVPPQANRSVGPSSRSPQTLAARIVDENDNGIVDPRRAPARDDRPVRGRDPRDSVDRPQGHRRRRPVLLRLRDPCDAPGLRFLCRESFDLGRSRFDHPLASRFEEIDAIVVFDDVLVP